jgi:2-polyprenyl-3-methyl-5-hydroxy-6-metoxy-1,4-benzoquinol methylase
MEENAGISCRRVTCCELCGLPGTLLYSGLSDGLFGAPGIWGLVRCTECRLIWCDPHPMPDQIQKLYGSYYTHSVPAEAPSARRSPVRAIKRILATIFFWRAPVFRTDDLHLEGAKPGRLLEIGCGSGSFLTAMSAKGWDAVGVDFDQKAIDVAKKRHGENVRRGELINCQFANDSFDAIIMNNVIEHVWNPVETVSECFRILKPNGRLVMITPNSDSDGHKLFKRDWRGLEPPRHLFIYNRSSLRRLVQNAGFARCFIFSSSGGHTGLDMLRASAKERQSNSMLRKIILLEKIKTLFGLPCGEWCVVICTR